MEHRCTTRAEIRTMCRRVILYLRKKTVPQLHAQIKAFPRTQKSLRGNNTNTASVKQKARNHAEKRHADCVHSAQKCKYELWPQSEQLHTLPSATESALMKRKKYPVRFCKSVFYIAIHSPHRQQDANKAIYYGIILMFCCYIPGGRTGRGSMPGLSTR